MHTPIWLISKIRSQMMTDQFICIHTIPFKSVLGHNIYQNILIWFCHCGFFGLEYVTEFWKITHMGACKIIKIFMIDGFLLRAEHTFKT